MVSGNWNFITAEMLVFFAIAAGVVIAFLADRARRRKIIEAKMNEYHLVLNTVHQVRLKYSRLMSEVISLRKQLDQYDVELLDIKKRIVESQADARESLKIIIMNQEEAKDKLDMKVVEQQKINFEQEWKVIDSFKIDYIKTLDLKKVTQVSYDQLVQNEENAGQEWVEEKNRIIRIYKELVKDVPDLVYPEL